MFLLLLFLFSVFPQPLSSFKNITYKNSDGDTKYWAIIAGYGANPHQIPCVNREIKKIVPMLKRYNWNEEQMIVLQNEYARKEALMDTFDWLITEGVDEDDVVLIFFSFHGSHKSDTIPFDEPNNMDGFLVTFDFEYEILENGILDDEFGAALDKIPSKNVVVIVESCHAGEMIDGSEDLCGDGRVILTSCTEEELSFFLYRRVIGLFPYYIFKGMSGFADRNHNGWISAEELFQYAEMRTIIQSYICSFLMHSLPYYQHPQMYDGWPEDQNNSSELEFIKYR
jgi:hypothetical protein